jgi:hypothetical protein
VREAMTLVAQHPCLDAVRASVPVTPPADSHSSESKGSRHSHIAASPRGGAQPPSRGAARQRRLPHAK